MPSTERLSPKIASGPETLLRLLLHGTSASSEAVRFTPDVGVAGMVDWEADVGAVEAEAGSEALRVVVWEVGISPSVFPDGCESPKLDCDQLLIGCELSEPSWDRRHSGTARRGTARGQSSVLRPH
jgi:hypothetical protein